LFFYPFIKLFFFNFIIQSKIKFILYFNFDHHSFNCNLLFWMLLYNWNFFSNYIFQNLIQWELSFMVFRLSARVFSTYFIFDIGLIKKTCFVIFLFFSIRLSQYYNLDCMFGRITWVDSALIARVTCLSC